jgi:hypothetical protein
MLTGAFAKQSSAVNALSGVSPISLEGFSYCPIFAEITTIFFVE